MNVTEQIVQFFLFQVINMLLRFVCILAISSLFTLAAAKNLISVVRKGKFSEKKEKGNFVNFYFKSDR